MSAATLTSRKRPRRQTEIRQFRRQSLLRAALITVGKYDIEGATVARICAAADASRGLIAHYFSSKEELLVSAIGGLFAEAQALKEAIARDTTLEPLERIRRIAHSSFEEPIYSWEAAAAWQAFTNASRHNSVYRDPIRASTQNSVDTVAPLFTLLEQRQQLRISVSNAAMGLYMLIDGLWNSLATGKDELQIAQAISFCDTYIEGCLRQN
jgi:TetR/AcrR family transcriptional regulator, transcriptional repressor of bet genes